LQRRRSLGLDRDLLRAALTYALNLPDRVADELDLAAGDGRRFSRFMGPSPTLAQAAASTSARLHSGASAGV
jgi:hypothetical protein